MKRYLALFLITAAGFGCDAMTSHTDVVARAGQHELTVDEAVELLAPNPRIPPMPDMVTSIANLWIDYTLLAQIAVEDTALATLDLQPLLRPYVEQQVFAQLRDQVITADTVISDTELRAMFEEQAPGSRVRARHVLLTFPDSATEAERDSVFALARQIQERAAAGEDLAALAREYSEDQGTAQQGGDLGWFRRGTMVAPFEEAAFALEPGEVSDVVETPFGLHIIKVYDRERQSFEDARTDFRATVINERRQASLDQYVGGLQEGQDLEVQEGATEVARDLADDMPAQLQGRAASRELVSWEDGALTASELLALLRGIPPQQRGQYASLNDQQMTELLRDVATNELVLADAEARGISVPQSEQDSLLLEIRTQLTRMVRDAGLAGPPQEEETEAEAVERRVRSLLTGILSGQRNVIPTGGLSSTLRADHITRINEQAVTTTVERIEERRASAQGQQRPMMPQQGPQGQQRQEGQPQTPQTPPEAPPETPQ